MTTALSCFPILAWLAAGCDGSANDTDDDTGPPATPWI